MSLRVFYLQVSASENNIVQSISRSGLFLWDCSISPDGINVQFVCDFYGLFLYNICCLFGLTITRM